MTSQGMRLLFAAVLLMAVSAAAFPEPDVTELKINVEHKPKDCSRQAKVGDTIKVHYAGYLTDGKKFDSSFDRNDPIGFKLGQGQVIQGWEKGLEGACVGEKRKLHIPPALGYGDRGAGGIIPGGATLIFDTELVSING